MDKNKESKRIFVGIKMNSETAEAFIRLQAELSDLNSRFIKPEDMHLTLLPPMEMTDQSSIEDKMRQATLYTKRFPLKFERLAYGPNKARPKLAWIECADTQELITLRNKLYRIFNTEELVPFLPHVTIARFKKEAQGKLRHHPIKQLVNLTMPVESIELFESPRNNEVGYPVLASIPIPLNLNNMPH